MFAAVEFRLLGPFEIRKAGEVVPCGGTKQQTLLAYLCMNANRHVASDGLIDAIWGDAPPPSAKKNVQLYVCHLRRLVGAGTEVRLETCGDGYRLSVEPSQLDLERCQELLLRGREYLRDGSVEQASALLCEAKQLWRGQALSGLVHSPAMQAEAARLEQLWLSLLSEYYVAQLALGRHADVIPDLVRLVALYPHQEHLRGHVMEAMWRCGQRENALATYREAYRLMVDDLGIEPGRRLQLLYQAVLADEAWDPSAPAGGDEARPLSLHSFG